MTRSVILVIVHLISSLSIVSWSGVTLLIDLEYQFTLLRSTMDCSYDYGVECKVYCTVATRTTPTRMG